MNSRRTLFPRIHLGVRLSQGGCQGRLWLSVGLDRGSYQMYSMGCESLNDSHLLYSLEIEF